MGFNTLVCVGNRTWLPVEEQRRHLYERVVICAGMNSLQIDVFRCREYTVINYNLTWLRFTFKFISP